MNDQSALAVISDFVTIAVDGAQASQFLQGQFTCDIRPLQSGQAVLGACCDHKGRMLANGWIGRWQDNYILFLPRTMAATTLEHLQKFAVFSKVTLQEKTGWSALNYLGPALSPLPDHPIIQGKLPYPPHPEYDLHWLIGPQKSIDFTQTVLTEKALLIDSSRLQFLQVLTQLVFIQPATRALFIPQMIGLEKLGGVSFTKGCYVGQEVVARTQHLGQLKRHLQSLHFADALAPPSPGDSLFDEQNETVGQIATVSQDPNGGYLVLAVVQDRAQKPLSLIFQPQ